MTRYFSRIVCLLLITLWFASPVLAQGRRVALVIGNSDYKHSSHLGNPRNDAADMAGVLKMLGFSVIEGLDLDKASMERKVRDFAGALGGAQIGLFFYAGHGLQVSGQNYLVPIDAELATASAIDFELVRLDLVQRTMERASTTNILIVDGCRDNPLARNLARALGTRSTQIGQGFATVESGEGTLIGFSTQPGNVALDGTGRNSPYAAALLKNIVAPGDDLSTILINVRNQVMRDTAKRQVPWEHSAMTGKFYFIPPKASPAAPIDPRQAELEFWSSVKDSKSPTVLGAYLERYPDGQFAPAARALIENYRREAQIALPQAGPIHPGAVAVSGFSGSALSSERLPPAVNPIDKTFIDIEGPSLRIFDLSSLGGVPSGQIVRPPVGLELKARHIGQVFGLALDGGAARTPPNLYAAATSVYGIHIVAGVQASQGRPVRLKAGAPNVRFMDGQFGSLPGGSPGTIWKVDGATGTVSAFADTTLNGVANSGPGLGNLTYDPNSRSLYASDLDTGLMHRFSTDGSVASSLDQFDHGVAGRAAHGLRRVADDGRRMEITSPRFKANDISTWGFTQPERRVHGLAVHQGRLYYAVAAGPEIWSLDLNADGSFGRNPRLEVAVKVERDFPITDIVFDAQGRMVLAQRGAIQNTYDYGKLTEAGAQTLRYMQKQASDPASGLWIAEPEEVAVGLAKGHRAGTGGVGLGHAYRPDGSIDYRACGGTLAVTGDALSSAGAESAVHGLQLNDRNQVAAFVDFFGHSRVASARGHVGDVAMFQSCDGEKALPPAAALQPAPAIPAPAPSGGQPPPTGGQAAATPPILVPNAPNVPIGNAQNCIPAGPPAIKGITDLPPLPASTTNGLDGALALAEPPKCVRRGDVQDCTWTVAVSNPGTVPIHSDVILATPEQAIGDLSVSQDVAITTKPELHGIVTMFNGPGVPPKGATSFTIRGTYPWKPNPLAFKLRLGASPGPVQGPKEDLNPTNNRVEGGVPAGAPSEALGPDANTSCVATSQPLPPLAPSGPPPPPSGPPPPAPSGPPPQQAKPKLRIKKVAVSPNCALKGGCAFTITITNMGPGPYTGDLRFFERADSDNNQHAAQIDVWAAPANTPTQRWSCTPEKLDDGRIIETDCRQAVVLPEGASTSANVLIRPGEGWKKDNNLVNCATLAFQEGSIDDLKSCATVKLDPFGVQVVKIGDESCEPGGECRFEIEIFNPGPIVHDDPVTVVDNLSGLGSAPILSISPAAGAKAFPCAQPPTQVPFSCTGHMRLDVGERHKYVMTLRLPPSAPGGTSFRNCATVGSPESVAASRGLVNQVSTQAGGPKGSGLAPSGCHEVRIPLQCPEGWSGVHPTCCQPSRVYRNGRCEERASTPPQVWRAPQPTPSPLPSVAPSVTKDCPVGMQGTWPRCYRLPPPQTCQQYGMQGLWPNCIRPPQPPPRQPEPTCQQFGRQGLWPNCIQPQPPLLQPPKQPRLKPLGRRPPLQQPVPQQAPQTCPNCFVPPR